MSDKKQKCIIRFILVETSQAGPGNLEVTVNGGRVPTSAQAQGPHTYAISFTPREAAPHSVDLRFNGQDVPGSPFTCTIAPAARLVGPDTLDKISVGKTCQFYVESFTAPIVEILGPSRRPVSAKVIPHPETEARFNIEFIPIDVGDHSVEVSGAILSRNLYYQHMYLDNRWHLESIVYSV